MRSVGLKVSSARLSAGYRVASLALLLALILIGCQARGAGGLSGSATGDQEPGEEHAGVLTLPALGPASLDGQPLRVVATTSIVGDVVAQVGGEDMALTTLMGPGQDPHSYEPTPQQMALVSRAHVVFVNGFDLEETLIHDLEAIAEEVPLVAVSASIEPIEIGEPEDEHAAEEADHDDEHDHAGADPHVWFSIPNVERWVANIAQVLSSLDPEHAAGYASRAQSYLAELAALRTYADAQFAAVPIERRVLVTNHDSLGYLARDYQLQVVGTVIPGASTLAEPSASDLAALIATMREHDLCTLFAETTVSDRLARTVAGELAGCAEVRVVKLYTGAVGPTGSGAESYVSMYRANVDAIVGGLR